MRTRIRACSQVSCNRVWLVHRAWANHQYPLVESDTTSDAPAPACVHAAATCAVRGKGLVFRFLSSPVSPAFCHEDLACALTARWLRRHELRVLAAPALRRAARGHRSAAAHLFPARGRQCLQLQRVGVTSGHHRGVGGPAARPRRACRRAGVRVACVVRRGRRRRAATIARPTRLLRPLIRQPRRPEGCPDPALARPAAAADARRLRPRRTRRRPAGCRGRPQCPI